MYAEKKFLGIIPARGGSKGIPHKNIVNLKGKALIEYTISAAKGSKYIDYIVCSTDSDDIKDICIKNNIDILERSPELAKDSTPTEPVMLDVVMRLERKGRHFDYIVLLQPTSPLRTNEDIDLAIQESIMSNADSLLSVHENDSFLWSPQTHRPLNYNFMKRPRRQDKKWELLENGAIYITKVEMFKSIKNRLLGNISFYIMEKNRSIDIDEPFDLFLAEKILEYYEK